MLRSIKAVIILGALIVSALYGLLLAQIILAEPQLPHTFKGTVIIGGKVATGGDVQIRVKTGDDPLQLQDGSSNVPSVVDGSYILFARADDPATTESEGGKRGEELKFFVVFNPGTAQELEVQATTSVTPVLFLPGGVNADPNDTFDVLDILVEQPDAVQNLTRTTPDTDNTPSFSWNSPITAPPAGIKTYQVATGDTVGSIADFLATATFLDFTDPNFFTAECLTVSGPISCATQAGQATTIGLTLKNLLADGDYRIAVRWIDNADGVGPASTISFTIKTVVPVNGPVLVAPAQGAIISGDGKPLFDWNKPTEGEPTVYTLQVVLLTGGFNTGPFTLNQALQGSPPPDQFQTTQAIPEGNYKWRVLVTDAIGTLKSSEEIAGQELRTFTIKVAVPVNPPILVAPAQGAIISGDGKPEFRWNKPTEGEPTVYRLQVVKSGDSLGNGPFALDRTLLGNPPPNQFQTTQAIPDGDYKWRVQVADADGNSALSAVRTFILDATAPLAPVLIEPTGVIRDATPTYKWSPAADPPFNSNLTYTLEVALGTADFSNLVFTQTGIVDQNTSTPNVIEFTRLSPDLAVGRYIWRVKATDRANNTGPFSTTPLSFQVAAAIDLRLLAKPNVVRAGSEVEVEIEVKPRGGQEVNQVNAYLDFVSDDLELVSVTPAQGIFDTLVITTSDRTVDVVAKLNQVTSTPFVLATATFKAKEDRTNADRLTAILFSQTGDRTSDAIFAGGSVIGSIDGTDLNILTPTLDIQLTLARGFDDYRGLAKDEIAQVEVNVLQFTSGQKVEAVDVLLDYNTSDFEVLEISRGDPVLPVELENSFDPNQGLIRYSAMVTTGGSAVSGRFLLATVRLRALRATQSLDVGFSRLQQPNEVAGLKGIDVLNKLIGFPVDLALEMTVRSPFLKPFVADVNVVVRPNGNGVRAVDALLSYTPQGITVNDIKPGDGTLEEVLVSRTNPNATIDIGAATTGDLPKREFVLAVLEITSSSDPSTSDRIDFTTAFPKGSVGAFDGVALPVRVTGITTKIPPPGPVTNLRKQPDSLDNDETPTFRWDPPVASPAAGIKEFDAKIIGADGTISPPNQAVALKCFDANALPVAGDCLNPDNLKKVTSFEFTSIALADGRYILQVAVVDNLVQASDKKSLGFIVDKTPPSVPVPSGTFAVDGAFTNLPTPELAWLTSVDTGNFTATGDLDYDVEVATTEAFSNIVGGTTVQALSWPAKTSAGSNLAPNAYYWWRVKSVDQATRFTTVLLPLSSPLGSTRGNESAFSTPLSFLIDNIAPTKPGAPVQVRKGAAADNITGSFTWSRSTDPGFVPGGPRLDNTGAGVDFYRVVIAGAGKTFQFDVADNGNNCPSGVCQGELNADRVPPNGVLTPAKYTVTVTAFDKAGNFITEAQLVYSEGPPGVVLELRKLTPDSDNTPTFEWNRPSDEAPAIITYLVATGDANNTAFTGDFVDFRDPGNPLFTVTSGDNTPITDQTDIDKVPTIRLTFKNPLEPDGNYRLGVRANLGGTITVLPFTVDTNGPVITGLTRVPDDSKDDTPGFEWESTDLTGVKFHRVHIESERLVDVDVPGTPTLITPSLGQNLNVGSKPTLTWNDVLDIISTGGEISYIVELGQVGTGSQPETGDFALPVHRDIVAGKGRGVINTSDVPSPLANGTYKWHARAVDRAGNLSSFSELVTFTVGPTPAPGVPTLLFPRDGSTGSNTRPIFQWTQVKGFQYGLEIGTSDGVTGDGFATPVFTADQIATPRFTLTTADALNTGDYAWRVRAELGILVGAFSQAGSFTVTGGTITDVRFHPANPGDLSVTSSGDDTTPEIVWGQSTGGNLTPLTYTLVVKSGDPAETIFSKSGILSPESLTDDVRFVLPPLVPAVYDVQVRASDEAGVGNISSFTTKPFTVVPDDINPVVTLIGPTGTADSARPPSVGRVRTPTGSNSHYRSLPATSRPRVTWSSTCPNWGRPASPRIGGLPVAAMSGGWRPRMKPGTPATLPATLPSQAPPRA